MSSRCTVASPVFHVGDIGTEFIVQILTCDVCGTNQLVPVDVSTATTKEICLQSPDATTHFTAGFASAPCGLGDGTDGKISYVTASAADLNRDGTWKIAAKIIFADGRVLRTDFKTFQVKTPVCS
jgi:hypothetical protein